MAVDPDVRRKQVREANARYGKTPKGRAASARYRATDKRKAALSRYGSSEKCLETKRKFDAQTHRRLRSVFSYQIPAKVLREFADLGMTP